MLIYNISKLEVTLYQIFNMEDTTMAEFFEKFEEIWAVLWDYIYKVLAHFDINLK